VIHHLTSEHQSTSTTRQSGLFAGLVDWSSLGGEWVSFRFLKKKKKNSEAGSPFIIIEIALLKTAWEKLLYHSWKQKTKVCLIKTDTGLNPIRRHCLLICTEADISSWRSVFCRYPNENLQPLKNCSFSKHVAFVRC